MSLFLQAVHYYRWPITIAALLLAAWAWAVHRTEGIR